MSPHNCISMCYTALKRFSWISKWRRHSRKTLSLNYRLKPNEAIDVLYSLPPLTYHRAVPLMLQRSSGTGQRQYECRTRASINCTYLSAVSVLDKAGQQKWWNDEAMKRWSDEAMKRWSDEAMKRWSDEAMKRWSDEAMKRWSDAMKRLTLHRFNFFASVKRFIASLI